MVFQDMVMGMVDAFKGGQWSIFASFCVMMLVFVVTKSPLAAMIKGKHKVWIAAVAGMLMAVAMTVATTGNWANALMQGLNVGMGSVGLFELLRRTLSKEAVDANNDGVLDPK